ncbi:porin opacity type [Chlorobaculum parvum NCIB 8327]|uniref:Porin opacity type n=1 Tax=Chlorobaculum parvum (strain DSM 263 / NCIMB 8327) TaxID=517417 RepID=B3QLD0_CHLP8|nr:outer membrane beta-barrel protein [Chlorobaculum parvum]ACF12368.1 porin opacity type [Chlorobaculum parvum NCIB 8327]
MKQITRMATLGVLLLAGASGTAFANGTSAPEPAPIRYTPPPPPPPAPAPAPVVDTCEPGPYISISAGIGIPEDIKAPVISQPTNGYPTDGKIDMENGLALNGAIGYDFGDARLEAAVGYQSHDIADSEDDIDISLLTVMANAYYDINTGSDVSPYIMAGAGWAHVGMPSDESDDVFAWQVGAGLGVKVSECTTLDLGYRYLKPNKFGPDGNDVYKWAVHNVMLGLRFNF